MDIYAGQLRQVVQFYSAPAAQLPTALDTAIDRELTRDEANGMAGLLSDKPDHELFAELRHEIFGGKPLPGSSADLIREAREIRDAETERWA